MATTLTDLQTLDLPFGPGRLTGWLPAWAGTRASLWSADSEDSVAYEVRIFLTSLAEGKSAIMTYYRIAGRLRPAPTWSWRTSKLGSLQAVWIHLQRYQWASRSDLRVFFASSVDGLEEMLTRANDGKASTSVAAEHVVSGRPFPAWEMEEVEHVSAPNKPLSEDAHPLVKDASLPARKVTQDPLDVQRLELELGAGGDHDMPYRFAWPTYWPQALAWIRLRRAHASGE